MAVMTLRGITTHDQNSFETKKLDSETLHQKIHYFELDFETLTGLNWILN